MRFSTYISIAGRKNRMSVKINVSVSRSILNLDCGPWDFFEMAYFLRNVWISVIDWTFFTCCFCTQRLWQKTAYFRKTSSLEENLRDHSLDNLFMQKIQQSVYLYLISILSLFKKSLCWQRRFMFKCRLTALMRFMQLWRALYNNRVIKDDVNYKTHGLYMFQHSQLYI